MSPGSRATDPARASPGAQDLAADEWDRRFDAVMVRLEQSAAAMPDRGAAAPGVVQDCVQALRRLQASLVHGRRLHLASGRELLETRAALASARLELAGTRAGERRARHQAQHDELTSLPNRGYFRDRLEDALNPADRRAPALAVLFLDLDGFKPINDRHGHETGDELLRVVARRLSGSIRAGDMVCRLGGDEFACMLAERMDREELGHVASKLFDAVSAPLTVGPLQFNVRPSIGIAVCPGDGDTAAGLLKRADAAMYRAKRRQMGYAFFDHRSDV
ncbi:MAG: GGDEF domain-containing protein [Burkholderiales bacterium]|nr:GGDEF domain-containing protein [Burkholderiales bacterium]MDE2451960.1 GGDEF domain-containing protein [Burkholderiales bacterium]